MFPAMMIIIPFLERSFWKIGNFIFDNLNCICIINIYEMSKLIANYACSPKFCIDAVFLTIHAFFGPKLAKPDFLKFI